MQSFKSDEFSGVGTPVAPRTFEDLQANPGPLLSELAALQAAYQPASPAGPSPTSVALRRALLNVVAALGEPLPDDDFDDSDSYNDLPPPPTIVGASAPPPPLSQEQTFVDLLRQHLPDPLARAVAQVARRRATLEPPRPPPLIDEEIENLPVSGDNSQFRLTPAVHAICGSAGIEQYRQLREEEDRQRRLKEMGIEEVHLTMLPPFLSQPSCTPLHEKDAFQGSTPPLPVRGAPARRDYLQEHPSRKPALIEQYPPTPIVLPSPRMPLPEDSEQFSFGTRMAGDADENQTDSSAVVMVPSQPETESVPTPPSPPKPPERVAVKKGPRRPNLPLLNVEGTAVELTTEEKTAENGLKEANFIQSASPSPIAEASVANPDSPPPPKRKRSRSQPDPVPRPVTEDERRKRPKYDGPSSPEWITPRPTQVDSVSRSARESVREDQATPLPTILSISDSKLPEVAPVSDSEPPAEGVPAFESESSVHDQPPPDPESDAQIENEQKLKSKAVKAKSKAKAKGKAKAKASIRTSGKSGRKSSVQEFDELPPVEESDSSFSPVFESSVETSPVQVTGEPMAVRPQRSAEMVTSADRRISCGIQASPAPAAGRRGRTTKKEKPKPAPKATNLRRISITEGLEEAPLPRQRPQRVRVAPLQWWKNEHIEYEATDAMGTRAYRAKAIYKVEETKEEVNKIVKPAKKGAKRGGKKEGASASGRSSGRKGSSTGRARASAARSQSRGSGLDSADGDVLAVQDCPTANPPKPTDVIAIKPVSVSQEWLDRLENPPAKPSYSEVINGEEQMRMLRWKSVDWMDIVGAQGEAYKVRLLLQLGGGARMNCCLISLRPLQSKGLDSTKDCHFCIYMVSGEVRLSVTGSQNFCLKLGDQLIIPPAVSYDITNTSRSRSASLLVLILQ